MGDFQPLVLQKNDFGYGGKWIDTISILQSGLVYNGFKALSLTKVYKKTWVKILLEKLVVLFTNDLRFREKSVKFTSLLIFFVGHPLEITFFILYISTSKQSNCCP